MRKYGDLAIAATELARLNGFEPRMAWKEASRSVFPHSKSLQEKPCPLGAYLGLCDEGLVVGISAGSYTQSLDNKRYAIRAVELLYDEPTLAEDGAKSLWALVMNGQNKSHNSQMYVVLALWGKGMISILHSRNIMNEL